MVVTIAAQSLNVLKDFDVLLAYLDVLKVVNL